MYNSAKWLIPILVVSLSACSETSDSSLKNSNKESKSTAINLDKSTTRFAIGTDATKELINGWDIDIAIDGSGLPEGSGSVAEGEQLYDNLCAACHGTFGEGEEQWPKLTGGENSLTDQRPLKTIGSYWPYSTTLWDYINRAMPFPAPQSLEVNQVYAITAYVLNMNDIVSDEFILTNQNLASIKMPNAQGFYLDDRPDTSNQRCMKDCKPPESIVVKSGPTYVSTTQGSPSHSELSKTVSSNGQTIYLSGCNLCHDNGLMQAPKIATPSDWVERQQASKDTIYQNAINGLGNMPAKGGRNDLSNNSIKQAVDYMLKTLE
jgi:S-disulfanyl-L-cysteine oxidoreductase SoxD